MHHEPIVLPHKTENNSFFNSPAQNLNFKIPNPTRQMMHSMPFGSVLRRIQLSVKFSEWNRQPAEMVNI
jgi:hypothetical protein